MNSIRYPGFHLACALTGIVLAFAADAAANPLGDLNRDCVVDALDVQLFSDQWLGAGCSVGPCADFDGSGVSASDLALLAANWHIGCDDITLVINELQADNEATIPDEQGDYDDWVEIYNDSLYPADIGGLYVTDDINWSNRWLIPPNSPPQTTVPPKGYALIWADKDPGDGPMHIDFSLNADGEAFALVAPDGATIIDSVQFGPQGNDDSHGRFPDAVGPWYDFGQPTPAADNIHSDPETMILSSQGDCVVVFNELMYNHPYDDVRLEWIEFYNQMAVDIDLSGWSITDGIAYDFPPGTVIGGGEYLVVASSPPDLQYHTGYSGALGPFSGRLSNGGERLRLRNNNGRVMDVIDFKDSGRWPTEPDGTGKTLAKIDPDTATKSASNWAPSAQINGTPGAANGLSAAIDTTTHIANSIVINEIMYNHQPLWETDTTPFADSNEEWIELYNRTAGSVNVSNWRLEDGIDFTIPAPRYIGAHDYLVIAKDSNALKAKFPAVSSKIIGDFTRSLSNKGERIRLVTDANAVIDEVRYYDDKPWPIYADGGGSSLELRDPDADNTKATAWADSNERDKSGWNTYTYRKVCRPGLGPGLWAELIIGLLDDGEVLLDDVSFVENPDTSAVEFIQNGAFESGDDHWRFGGTHGHSRVITDPDNASNHVFHLIATGPAENIYNHVETTYGNDEQVLNGREYEVSFRARWLAGCAKLNTHAYYNRVAKTTVIEPSQQNGTPGAQNSRYESNIGPTYNHFGHNPVVPGNNQTVTVTVVAKDPDGISSCTVWYRTDGGAWTSRSMTHQGSGRYTRSLPGRSSGTVVQFYVEAQDGSGYTSMFPPAGPDSRALYKVNDYQAASNGLHNFRILMLSDDYDALNENSNRYTNEFVPATVIYDEAKAFYDIGVHFKGSLYTRSNDSPGRRGWKIHFDADDLFRGVHDTISADRASSSGWCGQNFATREVFTKHTLNQAGGLPSQYDDMARLMPPPSATNYSYTALQMARYSDQYLDSAFQDGGDSMLFKQELIYHPTSTTDGDPESPKLTTSGSGWVPDPPFSDLGGSPEDYRGTYFVRSNRDRDDYSRLIQFCQAWSLPDSEFLGVAEPLMDVDQWLRAYAWTGVVATFDNYFGSHTPHNHYLYVRPSDNRIIFLPWDNDFHYECAGWHPEPWELRRATHTNQKIMNLVPKWERRYWGHIHDIITTTVNPAYLTPWAAHFDSLIPNENFYDYLDFYLDRADWILTTQLPAPVTFEITTNGGGSFSTSGSSVVIEGTAWIDVRRIEVTGRSNLPEFDWLDMETWQNTIDLQYGPNTLEFVAYDFQDNQIATDTIVVTRN